MPVKNNPTSNYKEKEKTRERLRDIALFLFIPTLVSTIITASFHSISLVDKGLSLYQQLKDYWIIERIQSAVNITNIVISFIAMVFFLKLFRKSNFLILVKLNKREKYKQITDAESKNVLDQKIKNNPVRVNNLISQYVLFITLFAFSLVAVYSAIIINNAFKTNEETQAKEAINEIESKLKDLNLTSHVQSNISEKTRRSLKRREVKVKEFREISLFDLLVNIINFSGALFIYLAFKVLHGQTLRDNHSAYTFFWVYPLCFSFLYILITGLFYLGYSSNYNNATIFLNITDLIAGLANGLAMALLFGRYVSIEQSVKETQLADLTYKNLIGNLSYKAVFSNAIIFVLPVYALAQLLFGSLTIDSFGDPKMFQTMVYLFCLIGKIFFFAVTYLMIKKNLLSLYLHGVVAKVGNYKDLEDCLNFVDKS